MTALSTDTETFTSKIVRQCPKKFTDEEVVQLKQAFALFDLGGNGFITNDELGTVLRKMGQEPTDEEVDAMIAEIDEDGDGTTTLKNGGWRRECPMIQQRRTL